MLALFLAFAGPPYFAMFSSLRRKLKVLLEVVPRAVWRAATLQPLFFAAIDPIL
jgi:hypothetical protein